MSDMTGKTIGQYEIHEEIGRGGMATVYRATQTSIGRTVAIKILPPNFMQDRTFLERFNREVQVIALLQHRSILPVYDYGEDDGQPYIVMAFMEGGTLSDRIRKGPMTFNDALRTITQIAEGLDYAHSQGIIHRDFKPSNVLLDGQGNAYLADFGIAKVSEATMQLTGSGVIGTPAYMAPEMFRKGDLTTAADVYALGITLYQMLTGHLPYEAETPVQFMMSHVNDPVPDVLSERPELPGGVHSVIEKAMAKVPENRFQTAASMAEAFLMADSGGTMPMPAQDELAQPVAPTPIASSTPREAERVSTPQPRPKRRGIGLWLVFGILLAAGAIIVVGGILVGAIILTGSDRNEQQGAFTDARRDGESERVNEDIIDNEPTPVVPTPQEVAVEIAPTFYSHSHQYSCSCLVR